MSEDGPSTANGLEIGQVLSQKEDGSLRTWLILPIPFSDESVRTRMYKTSRQCAIGENNVNLYNRIVNLNNFRLYGHVMATNRPTSYTKQSEAGKECVK